MVQVTGLHAPDDPGHQVDQAVIDGLMVNGSARMVGWFSGVVRLVQTGLLNTYAFLILFGILSGLTWMVWRYGSFLK